MGEDRCPSIDFIFFDLERNGAVRLSGRQFGRERRRFEEGLGGYELDLVICGSARWFSYPAIHILVTKNGR